jgi:glycosyltransferase involved in cell wall biosynthesis
MNKKSCLLILEYGIPHYRNFLFEYFNQYFQNFSILHSGERFQPDFNFSNKKGKNIKIRGEFSLVFFNPIDILKSDVVISTFNIYKPHTWFWILLFPWKKWVLWGQGLGKSNLKILKLFRKLIIQISTGYVVYTEKGKQNLVENGVNPDKISVAFNTLNINNHELTKGQDYFLYVGRIQERKGLEKAIKACIDMGFKLMIVGDGILKEKFKKEYGNFQNIIFREGIYDEDVLKSIFSNAMAYVSPDHVGLGVVHSFAYGVPVITNKTKEHAPEFEYCNDQNSYLYDNDSQLEYVLKDANENKREE